MSIVAEAAVTPEDLLTMPDGNRFELVNGQLVEDDMSFWSSRVGGELFVRLHNHNSQHSFGWVAPEGTSYQCFPDDASKVRRADVSFIRADRLTADEAREAGHLRVAPDLAVEVVSPNDKTFEVDAKVEDYLDAGVKLVWVINPDRRTVKVHRPGSAIIVLRERDELSADDILPGFRCPISDLFSLPPQVGQMSNTNRQ